MRKQSHVALRFANRKLSTKSSQRGLCIKKGMAQLTKLFLEQSAGIALGGKLAECPVSDGRARLRCGRIMLALLGLMRNEKLLAKQHDLAPGT